MPHAGTACAACRAGRRVTAARALVPDLPGCRFGLVYGLDLASFGVALVSVLLLPGLPPCRGGQPASLASLIGGITHMWSSQPLAGIFVIDLGAMAFGLPRAVFPALAATLYGGGAATVGYLNAAPGAGALAGSLVTGRVRVAGRRRAG